MLNWQKPNEIIVGCKYLVAEFDDYILEIQTRKTPYKYSTYSHNDSVQYLTEHALFGKNKKTNINLDPVFFDIGVNIKKVKEYANTIYQELRSK